MSNKKYAKMSVFEQIKAGLEDGIAYSKGELSLVTIDLPAPPPKPAPSEIAALRKKFKMSQAIFAATINVSKKTVQSWEQGAREPSDAALRMLQVIRKDPGVVQTIFSAPESGRAKKGRGSRPVGKKAKTRNKRRKATKT